MAQGQCPNCSGEELEYDVMEITGVDIYYNFSCDECGMTGKEWYKLTYTESELD